MNGPEKTPFTHIPVLPQETVQYLTGGRTSGKFRLIDCTLGRGGHSSMVLRQNPDAELLALDRDAEAIIQSAKVLEFAAERTVAIQCDFAGMKEAAEKISWKECDAILMDLGVSSPQIDDPGRGFSFRFNGPLDMRMDSSSPLTASRVLNTYEEEDLERIFRVYGELRESRYLARAIVAQRKTHPFSTTAEFASLCDQVLRRGFRKGGPPAPTLCFQALRIEVNDELGQLERALHSALEMLKPGGRLCVISFHSLEDRIVKQFMNSMAEKCKCPPKMPQCICNWKPLLEVLTKKPVTASEEELKENPRSACAKLRCAQRTEHPVRKEEQKKTTGTEGGLGK